MESKWKFMVTTPQIHPHRIFAVVKEIGSFFTAAVGLLVTNSEVEMVTILYNYFAYIFRLEDK